MKTLPDSTGAMPVPLPAGRRDPLVRRILRNPIAVGAFVFLGLVIVTAVIAPLLATHDPDVPSAADVLAPPSAAHWLGADGSGRDVYSRLLFAGRLSLLGAALAVAIAAAIGISTGLVAGYYSRWFETGANWVWGLVQSLPGVVVLLAAATILGPSVWTAMVIFGILVAPAFYRVVSATVAGVRGELYIDAAKVSGLGDGRIIVRHVLSVVRAPAIIQAANIACIAIAVQAGLSFLGLGDSSAASWGSMLNDGVRNMYRSPISLLWPSLIIALTCIALVLVSNAIRDALETSSRPARRRRRGSRIDDLSLPGDAPVVHAAAIDERPVLLDVRDLRVGYRQHDGSTIEVVHGVSLDVRAGEVHGLIGESGSGKTQTAWSILGLLPAGGEVLGGAIQLEGVDLSTLAAGPRRALLGSRIGYIPQEPMSNLDPSFTIGSQLAEPMRVVLGLGRKAAAERSLELLERVGIADPRGTARRYPHQISGGMAQRVLIAGAISCEPALLVADEPTTALDVTVQAEVLDLLRGLQRELGMGMLLVTHNFGVVADISDRVSVMRHGLIVETGPVAEIFADPRHEYTQSLFAAVLDPTVAREPYEEAQR